MPDSTLLQSHLESTHARELSELFRLKMLVDALMLEIAEKDARIAELEGKQSVKVP